MAKATLKCFECKQDFRREELINYTPLNSKIAHNYCRKCLEEKQQRENFSNKVCTIFGIKAPGPRIWTERKRLMDTFGYTDEIIIDCLDYIYNVENKKKLSESLYLVNPVSVDHMMTYKKRIENNNQQLVKAMANTKPVEIFVSARRNTKKIKENWDPDEWLDKE